MGEIILQCSSHEATGDRVDELEGDGPPAHTVQTGLFICSSHEDFHSISFH